MIMFDLVAQKGIRTIVSLVNTVFYSFFLERLPSSMASHRPHRCSLVNCGKVNKCRRHLRLESPVTTVTLNNNIICPH
jgi:hypothetical protein